MLAIFNKEFKSYFNSAMGYIFMGVFLLISGILFCLTDVLSSSSDFVSVLRSLNFIFLLLTPLLTMKIISEETKSKTDQLLYTSPLKLSDVILGKYFAAVALFLVSILITFIYPIILSRFASMAWKEILCAYLGFVLLGAAFIAIGLFISSLTESQVAAAVGTFGALLIVWVIDGIAKAIPTTSIAGLILVFAIILLVCGIIYYSTKNILVPGVIAVLGVLASVAVFYINKPIYEGFTAKFLGWFSLIKQTDNFNMGILSLSSCVYYISFAIAFVFFTIRVIEKRRWS